MGVADDGLSTKSQRADGIVEIDTV